MLFAFLLVRRSSRSPFGLSLRGIREKRAAHAGDRRAGRPAPVAVFTLAAAIAGIAGALLAQTTQFVGLDMLGFPRSAELLIMLVLGGTGRLYGALVGAAVFMMLQDYLVGHQPRLLAVLARRCCWSSRAVRARRHHGRSCARLRRALAAGDATR